MFPIDPLLPEVVAAVKAGGACVVEAPPGTGKTTRVPPALLDAVSGEVWVLEPRRIAARAAAAYVARERGEALGETVGYAMRFDRRAGPRTRLLYVTEALLTRRLAEDPELRGIGAVVLDEFHERSIHADVALAWVRQLRRTRPELGLVVMSATLDGEAVARFLGCPRLRATGTLHPVDVQYYARKDERPIEAKVAMAVGAVPDGDVLVFLPGLGEIARCEDALRADPKLDADVLPLHGELDADAQDRALRAGPRRRVVLATNVAETSVTVEGVRAVIDTGLARIAGHDPWSGLPTLALEPISRASADQRAGRAGRLGPGRCLRLYTKAEYDARAPDTPPEVRRIDLAGTVLDLGGRALEWFEPPAPAAWRAAVDLLTALGALNPDGTPTPLGRHMARLPVPPRVARVLLEGARLGVGPEAAALGALFGARRRGVADLVDLALSGEGGRSRERRQLEGLLDRLPGGARPRAEAAIHDALAHALFAGFADRAGKREGARVVLAAGGSAALDVATPGGDGFVVVTEAERVGGKVVVRSLTPIPADWLLDGAEVEETLTWVGERVEARERLKNGAIVLEDSPGRGDPEAVAALLYEHARPVAHRLFPDWEAAVALVRRVAWLRRVGTDVPALDLDALARAGCGGCRSFGDLGGVSLVALARHELGAAADLVDRLAPEAVPLPGRRRAAVEYPEDGDPFVASRMQDFFGLADGPRAGGRPLVLHLLAPNQRPVQVTTDLAGFWTRHWPSIRKELMRRYPRHRWPEDPLTAEAGGPIPRGAR